MHTPPRPARGVIFDLDGTLVDSQLDFAAMRREMELPAGLPILEAIAELTPPAAARCIDILHRHEAAAADALLAPLPGVRELLDALAQRGLRRAVVTRNSRRFVLPLLERLDLHFDPVLTREDEPIKPHPAAVWSICQRWELTPAEVVVIGDYRFDLECGRAAGARTVLFTAGRGRDELAEWAAAADRLLASFDDRDELLAWLAEPV